MLNGLYVFGYDKRCPEWLVDGTARNTFRYKCTHTQTPYCKNHNVFTTQRLFDRFITPCIDYIIDGLNNMRKQNPLKRVIHQTNLNMVTQFGCMFDAMFPALKIPSATAASNGAAPTKTASSSMWRTTSTSIDDDAIIECGFIDVKIQNVYFFFLVVVVLVKF